MGTVGRMIDEGDWPHTADLYNMSFGAAGSGYVMPIGNLCAPAISGTEEVTVDSGRVSFGVPEVYDYGGTIITLDSGTEFPRYDLLYLELSSGSVAASVTQGSDQRLPDIPIPETNKVIPIATLYWDENGDLTKLKDCRTVIEAEHAHKGGGGMQLDSADFRMDVDADERTLTVQNDVVEVKELRFASSDMQEGLRLEETTDTDALHVDNGVGLDFDADDKLEVVPSQIAGDGLYASGDNLHAECWDGLTITSDRVTLDDGAGVILRGTTPDRQVDLYHQDYGGLGFDASDQLKFIADDIDGNGMAGSNEILSVSCGEGLTTASGDLDIDVGRGLSAEFTDLNVNPASDGGLYIDGSDVLQAEMTSSTAGDGLNFYTDGSGNVTWEVTTGNGLFTTDGGDYLHMYGGSGIEYVSSEMAVNINTSYLQFDGSNQLEVNASGIAAAGLQGDGSNNVTIDAGGGFEIDGGLLEAHIDYNGLYVSSSGIEVIPRDLIDENSLIMDGSGNITYDPSTAFTLVDTFLMDFTAEGQSEEFMGLPQDYLMVTCLADGSGGGDDAGVEVEGGWTWWLIESGTSGEQGLHVEVTSPVTDTLSVRIEVYRVEWDTWMN